LQIAIRGWQEDCHLHELAAGSSEQVDAS
jgi:hypothetical protein